MPLSHAGVIPGASCAMICASAAPGAAASAAHSATIRQVRPVRVGNVRANADSILPALNPRHCGLKVIRSRYLRRCLCEVVCSGADGSGGNALAPVIDDMMRRFIGTVLYGAVLLTAHAANANPIEVGDWVHFNGSFGTLGGGAFRVDDLTDAAVPDFLTFCVQVSQHIDYSHDFRVGSITDYADDAGGPDPLSTETAWLMSSFSRGLLSAYSSNDIQWSIWQLEGEEFANWGNSAALINLAHLAVLGGWSNDGVQVLNLFASN